MSARRLLPNGLMHARREQHAYASDPSARERGARDMRRHLAQSPRHTGSTASSGPPPVLAPTSAGSTASTHGHAAGSPASTVKAIVTSTAGRPTATSHAV